MIVLDTHAWVWWAASPHRLSVAARRAIAAAQEIGVCAISCWEVAMLVAKNRLELDRPVLAWLQQALALPGIVLVPLSPAVAIGAGELGADFPGDPADRMIVATAREFHATLVTRDRPIRSSRAVSTIW